MFIYLLRFAQLDALLSVHTMMLKTAAHFFRCLFCFLLLNAQIHGLDWCFLYLLCK